MPKGICKYNKMIACREQAECDKCSWNPTYFEQLKEQRRNEREQKAGGKKNEKT